MLQQRTITMSESDKDDEGETSAASTGSIPLLLSDETGAHDEGHDIVGGGGVLYRYRDFSNVAEDDDDEESETSPQNGTGSNKSVESSIRVQKFPVKLYAILAQPEFQDIITWLGHGRSWKVLKPNLFETMVMPLFFEYSNYHSFNRLVNAWSFRRVSTGPDRGSYYHELFLRGKPHLLKHMRRLPKTHKKQPMKKDDEPNFYELDKTAPLPALEDAPVPGGAATSRALKQHRQQQMGRNGVSRGVVDGGKSRGGGGAAAGGGGMPDAPSSGPDDFHHRGHPMSAPRPMRPPPPHVPSHGGGYDMYGNGFMMDEYEYEMQQQHQHNYPPHMHSPHGPHRQGVRQAMMGGNGMGGGGGPMYGRNMDMMMGGMPPSHHRGMAGEPPPRSMRGGSHMRGGYRGGMESEGGGSSMHMMPPPPHLAPEMDGDVGMPEPGRKHAGGGAYNDLAMPPMEADAMMQRNTMRSNTMGPHGPPPPQPLPPHDDEEYFRYQQMKQMKYMQRMHMQQPQYHGAAPYPHHHHYGHSGAARFDRSPGASSISTNAPSSATPASNEHEFAMMHQQQQQRPAHSRIPPQPQALPQC